NPVLPVQETISVAASSGIASPSATLVTAVVSGTAAAHGDKLSNDEVPPVIQSTGPVTEKFPPSAAGDSPNTAIDQVSFAGMPPATEKPSPFRLGPPADPVERQTAQSGPVNQLAGNAPGSAPAAVPPDTPAAGLPFSTAPVPAVAAIESKPA